MATVTLTKEAPICIKGVEISLVEEKEKAVEKAARLRASDAKARADEAFVKAEDLLRTIQLCVDQEDSSRPLWQDSMPWDTPQMSTLENGTFQRSS